MEVSVIVPVYNTKEQKLRRCLNSIIKQEYKDFECIIIDDGSIAAVGKVCDEYATSDSRLKVIHKKNGGVGSARNVGLYSAKGKWIIFVDSDDFVTSEHIERLMSAVKADCDIIVCGYQTAYINSIKTHQYQEMVYKGSEGLRQLFSRTDFVGHQVLWDKAFRRSVIQSNRLSFNEQLTISEDRLFIYNYLISTRGVITTSSITYRHDSSDTYSLSGHYPTAKMQVLRYKFLSAASGKLIRHYHLCKEESKTFVDYNLLMLDLALHLPCHYFKRLIHSIFVPLIDLPLFIKYISIKITNKHINN